MTLKAKAGTHSPARPAFEDEARSADIGGLGAEPPEIRVGAGLGHIA